MQDVSAAGIALRLGRRFEPRAKVIIELRDATQDAPLQLLARIIHVTATGQGDWVLGCEFLTELSPQELQELLQPAAGNGGPPKA